MTISQITYFVSVSEMLNLTRVAEKFHVSQPAVSIAIRDLEAEFDVKLFDRSKNGLSLTKEGMEFYYKAIGLLKHYNSICNEMHNHLGEKNVLSIGTSRLISALYLPDIYKFIQRKETGYSLEIHEDSVSNMVRSVDHGMLDAALVSSRITNPELITEPVMPFKISFCIHKDLFYHPNKIISLADIGNIPLALFMKGSTHNTSIRKSFSEIGATPNIVFELSQVHTIETLIKERIAGGFLPSKLFKNDDTILSYDIKEYPPSTVYLIWKNTTSNIKSFKATLKDFSDRILIN